MASGSPYEEFVKTRSSTIKRSYAKGVWGVIFSAAIAVLGIVVGMTWLRENPGEWYRFAPFAITLVFGYATAKTLLEMVGGDVVLSGEGIGVGGKPVVRWSDIEQIQVQGTTTSKGREAFTAVVTLRLGPGDPRTTVKLPGNLTIPSTTLGPLIDQCRRAALG